ncbi:MAG: hypothetical protein RL885_31910 [Planctomycetota bacterium]
MRRTLRFSILGLGLCLGACESVVSYRPTAIGQPVPFETSGVTSVHGPGLPAQFSIEGIQFETKVQLGSSLTLSLLIRNQTDQPLVLDPSQVYRVMDDGEWVPPNDILRRTVGRSLGARPEPAELEPGSMSEWTFLYPTPLLNAPDQLTFLLQGLTRDGKPVSVLILVSQI